MSVTTTSIISISSSKNADERRLGELGYKQEFARAMTSWSNIGMSITVLSVPSAVLPYLYQGLANGGPMGMLITWPIVSICSGFVALAMAEIVSAYPTSGGLYYWSAQLAGPRRSAVVSYFTGWFNFIGLFGLTAGTSYSFGEIVAALFYMTGVLTIEDTPMDSLLYKFLVVAGGSLSLILSAFLCMADTKKVAIISVVSLWLNMIGMFIMTAGTAFYGDKPRTPLSELLKGWNNISGFSDGYAVVISLLGAAVTYCGYDSVAHLAEETISVAVAGPVAIISSVFLTLPVGWLVIWGFLSPIPINQYDVFSENPFTTTTAGDIFIYTQGPVIGLLQTLLWLLLNLTCVYGCLATWGRMGFAFARDGALPYSSYLYHLDKNKVPTRAMWVFAFLSILIMLPAMYSDTLYIAIDSMGTSSSYISYAIPIVLRIYRNNTFPRGPFNLGWFGLVNAVLATLWLLTASIIFSLPTETVQDAHLLSYSEYVDAILRNFNWSPVMTLSIVVFFSCFWQFRVRHYFKGPKLDCMTLHNNIDKFSSTDSENGFIGGDICRRRRRKCEEATGSFDNFEDDFSTTSSSSSTAKNANSEKRRSSSAATTTSNHTPPNSNSETAPSVVIINSPIPSVAIVSVDNEKKRQTLGARIGFVK